MGFWTIYMGIEGGGPAVAVSIDTGRVELVGTSERESLILGASGYHNAITGADEHRYRMQGSQE